MVNYFLDLIGEYIKSGKIDKYEAMEGIGVGNVIIEVDFPADNKRLSVDIQESDIP